MRVMAYCMTHYGAPYFGVALASLYDQVDTILILYTSTPSQGWPATLPNPDTEADLLAIAEPYRDKLIWHTGTWAMEGEHHDAVWQFSEGYDWLIRFDTDEVYQPGTVKAWIAQAETTLAKDFRAPFLHFWRSFGRVCRDAQNPQRMLRVRGGEGFAYLDNGSLIGQPEAFSVLHFGYAQPTRYIDYKMSVQGHHAEWRPDWYQTKWLPNAQTDVHPVVFDFWNTEPFESAKLPPQLHDHPYFGKELIE